MSLPSLARVGALARFKQIACLDKKKRRGQMVRRVLRSSGSGNRKQNGTRLAVLSFTVGSKLFQENTAMKRFTMPLILVCTVALIAAGTSVFHAGGAIAQG